MEANKPTEQQLPNTLCSVVAEPSTTHALRGVVNKVQVAFTISTGHVEEQLQSKRPPLNLALVLDRSGSMDSDKKLVNAKAAIKKVIAAMDEKDVLHLILYGSSVKVAFENANVKDKEALTNTVDKVRTEGMTNMYGGLSTAAEVVRKHSKQGYTNRIFLFSDGLVNEGVTDKPQIYKFISGNIYTEGDTKVSAFGLGKDFDEELMRAVAEHGCGAYFFIEGSSAIPRFVSFALKGLFSLVGTDARLSVRGLGSNIVTKIYSHGEDLTKPYRLDDLKQDDTRGVVCELQVTPTAEPSAEVLRWELIYRPATGGEAEAEANSAKDEAVKEHSISGTLRLHFTDDESEVAKAENGSVVAKVAIQRTGEIDAEITEHIKHGRSSEVITAYEKELEILRNVVDKDVDGKANIAGHLKHTESALEDFRREGASRANLKKAHHRNYMKRRTSACYDQQYLTEALQEVEDEATPPATGSGSASDSDDEPPIISSPVRRRNLRFS